MATRPPRLRNEADIQRARDWLDAAVLAMTGCGGLYLFLDPDFEQYTRWLSVVSGNSALRIIRVGSAREPFWFWPHAALVVIQAEVVDSGRCVRTRMPLTLPESPSSRDEADGRAWFQQMAMQVLGLEKSWKWFADPIAGDGELVRAASHIFEDIFCAEQRPWAVAKAVELGNYRPEGQDANHDCDNDDEVLP